MSQIAQPSRRSLEATREQTVVRQPRETAKRARLLAELTRQRALLLRSSYVFLTAEAAAEVYSDPADQASNDLEQDLAIQVKVRILAKLSRIERTIQRMRTSTYGRCCRCREDIPYERLMVQPDALFCVPCLTVVEQEADRN